MKKIKAFSIALLQFLLYTDCDGMAFSIGILLGEIWLI